MSIRTAGLLGLLELFEGALEVKLGFVEARPDPVEVRAVFAWADRLERRCG